MKIYLDNNLGVSNVEQEELTQDTIGYNILKVYIPNAVLTPYDTFTCYYGALLQNGRKVGWFAMEARTSSDADYEENYTLYKATLEQCVVSVEGKVYIGCQVLLGNSGNAALIKKNTAVVQFNVRKSVAINNDILVLDPDQTNTDVLESYKNLLENALLTYATKATTYTKTEVDGKLDLKADKSNTYTKQEINEEATRIYTYIDQVDTSLNTRASHLEDRTLDLENDVENLKSVQNVVEVVATKSALNSYDTSKLGIDDKVQVIADETHDGASTIYNWDGTQWQYVGAYGTNSYTKQESDNTFAPKSTAITHSGNQLKDYRGNNIYPNLDAKTQAKIDNAYGPAYVGKDTSTNILAKTSNQGIWIGTDTGHWYYWNGTQYVDGGVYQATQITDGEVHYDKTDFIDGIVNILDLTDTTNNIIKSGYYCTNTNYPNGSANSDYAFVRCEVKPNTTYTLKAWFFFAELNSSETFIRQNNLGQNNLIEYTFTTLATTKYILFNTTPSALNTSMVIEGATYPNQYYSFGEYYTFKGTEQYVRKGDNVIGYNQTKFIKNTVNILDLSTATIENNKYVMNTNYPNGASNSGYAFIVAPVLANTQYTVRMWFFILFIDENDNVIDYYNAGQSGLTNYTFTTPNNCVKIAFNTTPSSISTSMIVEGNTYPNKYIEYGNHYEFKDNQVYAKKDEVETIEKYYVGANKQYTTFTQCIRALANNTNKKIIYIDEGTYNIFNEIGGSEYALSIPSGTSWFECNDIIPDNTTIIGLGDVIFNFMPTSDEIGNIADDLLSPINIHGNVSIENITINADNCRYCIHDETGDGYNNSVKSYKNVKCFKYSSDGLGKPQAYASGFYKGVSYNFENCYFQAPVECMSFHDRNFNGGNININNCAFVSTSESSNNYSIRFGNVAYSQKHHKAYINNCYISSRIYINAENGNEKINSYDIQVVGCNNPTVSIQSVLATNIYTPKVYN